MWGLVAGSLLEQKLQLQTRRHTTMVGCAMQPHRPLPCVPLPVSSTLGDLLQAARGWQGRASVGGDAGRGGRVLSNHSQGQKIKQGNHNLLMTNQVEQSFVAGTQT